MKPPRTDAEEKVRMLRGSLRCFARGLLAWLPVIGLIFAVSALVSAHQVRVAERRFWNAGRWFRIWGTVSAALALFGWLALAAKIAWNIANNASSGGSGSYD